MDDIKRKAGALSGLADLGLYGDHHSGISDARSARRYFFHLRSDDDFIRDESGILVSDVDAIWVEAHRAIEELKEADPESVPLWDGWRLEVRDSIGNLVGSFWLDAPVSVGGLLH